MLLENGEAVRFCAAYINLNPVRAGLCENPEDYRWCSYAAAMGGDVGARRGLARAWGTDEVDFRSAARAPDVVVR